MVENETNNCLQIVEDKTDEFDVKIINQWWYQIWNIAHKAHFNHHLISKIAEEQFNIVNSTQHILNGLSIIHNDLNYL